MSEKGYQLVTAYYADDLGERVTALLADGWQLYGPPTMTAAPQGYLFGQALVRNETAVGLRWGEVAAPPAGAER